ncbi:helix-turn-helix domain-containing protein [Micromonospora sp. NPDC048898]|uniref:helix-turn-helix domain-containing protein n=1 Tax=Micromonospora sp. NPDC048898 TaxID=3364260 RepID=UPI00371E0D5E
MANDQYTDGTAPDPATAGSAAEFVAQMRALRQWSGLTIRQVSKRARDAGDVLPHSTLNSALGRANLPRETLVAAFVRACGGDQDTVDHWVAARKVLAAATAGQPEPVAVAVAADPGMADADSFVDEPRVRPPWGLLDAVPPLPAELASEPGWGLDGPKPPAAETADRTGDPAAGGQPVATAAAAGAPLVADARGAGGQVADTRGAGGPLVADARGAGGQVADTRGAGGPLVADARGAGGQVADTRGTGGPLVADARGAADQLVAVTASVGASHGSIAAGPSPVVTGERAPGDESALSREPDPAGGRPEPAADESTPTEDRPVRPLLYADGPLATAVKGRRNSAWAGLHRKRAPNVDAAAAPLRLRDFVPPLAFRFGRPTRALLGVLVLLLIVVAGGIVVRTLRDPDAGNDPPLVFAEPTASLDVDVQLPPADVGAPTSSPSPSLPPTSASAAPAVTSPAQSAPRSSAPRSSAPQAAQTKAAATLPAAGQYRMMPAATVAQSYCVGVGPEPGNDRPEVATLVSCAQAEPATSELRKVDSNTYQIYWAHPSGGGGCLQVDPDPSGQPSTVDGQLVAPRSYCNRPDQRFILEPVQTSGGQGYRLHATTAPNRCIGPIGGGRAAGTAIAQVSCSNDNVQVFLFKR